MSSFHIAVCIEPHIGNIIHYLKEKSKQFFQDFWHKKMPLFLEHFHGQFIARIVIHSRLKDGEISIQFSSKSF